MGHLQKLFGQLIRDGFDQHDRSCFDGLTEEELEAHLGMSRYGDFELTEAVRPPYDLQVVPSRGYRHDAYRDKEQGTVIPVLMASETRAKLFELFLKLTEPLGEIVDVVLETSHKMRSNESGHEDLYREHIDAPVLQSILCDYQDLLTNDGCTGIVVLHPELTREVQFDEHKLLIVYPNGLSGFEEILRSQLECREEMKFILDEECEHVHSSRDRYKMQFDELKTRLGIDEWSSVWGS
ncbi:MAG: hypothetical protein ABIA92_05245 [Patescibacteria group bacterium]